MLVLEKLGIKKINMVFKEIPSIKKETRNTLNESLSLDKRNWEKFKVSKIFGDPVSGKDYPQYLRVDGSLPLIGSSSKNNGIVDFITPNKFTPDKIIESVISVNRNGSVGYSFYHPYKAYFSGDTRYLKLPKKNKYIALFLTTVISQQRIQFGYGFKLGTERKVVYWRLLKIHFRFSMLSKMILSLPKYLSSNLNKIHVKENLYSLLR